MTVIEQRSVRHDVARSAFVAIFILFSLAVILYRVRWYYLDGGDIYLQLDWLVNFADGPVRRGVSGEIALALSRLFDVDVLLVVVAFQGLVTGAIILASGLVAWRHRFHDRALLLLLAPGYISYFIYNTPGSLRKEILGYLAFLPLLIAPKNDRSALVWMGLAFLLYALALAFHEGNAFLLPFFGFAMVMRIQQLQSHRRVGTVILALSGLAAVLAMLFAARFTHIDDLAPVCAAVIARGISEELCYSGIMLFLSGTHSSNTLYGLTVWADMNPPLFFAGVLVCLLPLVVLVQSAPHRGRALALVLGSGLSVLPLFVMGLDWGRWLIMYTTSVTLALWVYMDAARPAWFAKPLPPVAGPLLLLFCMCFGITHFPAQLTLGILPEFIDVVGDKVFGL